MLSCYRSVLLICICSLLSRYIVAQEYIISEQYISQKDGLSSALVNDIYYDKQGFIWILTSKGLDRYDGENIVNFDTGISITAFSKFNKVYQDINGLVWLCQENFKFFEEEDRPTFEAIELFDPLNNWRHPLEGEVLGCPFQLNEIEDICEDQSQVLWFALSNGEVWSYDGHFKMILRYHPGLTNVFSKGDYLWLGAKDTLIEINKDGTLISKEQVPGKIFNFWVDDDNILWLKTGFSVFETPQTSQPFFFYRKPGQKLTSFFGEKFEKYNYLNEPYLLVKEDLKDRIWFYSMNGSVVFDKSGQLIFNFSNYPDKIKTENTSRLYTFSKGLAWLISLKENRYGIFSLALTSSPFRKYLHDSGEPYSIRGMSILNDSVLLVNTYRGYRKLNLNTNSNTLIKSTYDYLNGYGITKSANNIFYSGNHARLITKFDQSGNIIGYLPSSLNVGLNDLLNVFEDKNQTLWFGGSTALEFLQHGTDSLQVFDKINGFNAFSDLEIRHFYENEEGLWLSTSKGLFLLDFEVGIKAHFDDFPSNELSYVHEDQEGVFWIATLEAGLIKWNPRTQKLKNYTQKDGLSDNIIYAVIEDDYGRLWMPSNFGLMSFEKKTEEVTRFYKKDGLAHNEFNTASYLQSKDGTIYLGGLNGITAFHPKDFQPKQTQKHRSPVVTKFEKIDLSTGALKDETTEFIKAQKINLSPDDKSFILRFSAMDYEHVSQKSYAYKIVNLDESWISIDENFIRFNRLPYGDFELKIRSLSSDRGWSDILTVPIYVAKPIYLKRWFIIVSLLMLIFSVWGLIRYRTYTLRKRSIQLKIEVFRRTQLIEQQKKELEASNRFKDKFMAVIGHDLKAPLLSLRNMSEKVQFLINQKRFDDIQKLSASIDKSSTSMIKLVDNLFSWALMQKEQYRVHLEPLYLMPLVNEVVELYRGIGEIKGVDIKLETTNDFLVFADRNALLTVLRNLMDNAIKYTTDGRNVLVYCIKKENRVQLQIENFGSLIQEQHLQALQTNRRASSKASSGLGLLICKELVTLCKGTFSIYNKTGGSTVAEIHLKVSVLTNE